MSKGRTKDYVFVRAGEKQQGENALSYILKNQLDIYLKMCGPYVSPDTIKLLSNAPSGIDILVLTDNIKDANTQSGRK